MKINNSNIWFHKEEKMFFWIPDNTRLEEGDYLIQTFDQRDLKVKKDAILMHVLSEDKVSKHLQSVYKQNLEKTKESLLQLNKFASITGRITEGKIKNIADNTFFSLKDNEKEPFTLGKELVQELIENVKNTNLTEEESQEAFKSTFQKVPEILGYFEENKLSKAAQDPETWANEMYQKLYGDIEEKKKNKNENRLKQDIKNSIANGLRNAGIEPVE